MSSPLTRPLRGLSIWQPHAERVLTGAKVVENRVWRTDYRGPVLLHAPKRFDPGGEDLPRGVILGVFALLDCHEADTGDVEHEGIELSRACCRRGSDAMTLAQFNALGGDIVGSSVGSRGRTAPRARLFHLMIGRPRRFAEPIAWPGREALWVARDPLLLAAVQAAMLDLVRRRA